MNLGREGKRTYEKVEIVSVKSKYHPDVMTLPESQCGIEISGFHTKVGYICQNFSHIDDLQKGYKCIFESRELL